MYLLNILISAIIIIVGIIIGTQNGSTIVEVNILWWNFKNLSLSLIMLESMLFGMIIIMLIAVIYEIKQRAKIWRLKKRIANLQQELNKVRDLVAENVSVETDLTEPEEPEEGEKEKDTK